MWRGPEWLDPASGALLLGALVLGALLLGALAALAARRGWARARARRRAERAVRGEARAEQLLAAHGWSIEARQACETLRFHVDGVPAEARVRCDLLVRRSGRRCVAEVKTGALAPRLDHAPTRRQLLEYRLAFAVDGVLLVDVEAGRVHEVVFPHAAPRADRAPLAYVAYVACLVLGAFAAALALRTWR